ncbi:MAG TPA: metallopeptidase family protein [Dermatophilaceae bacterium]|nr:metallopeptidase family protein [Dermatophilaceae bacterium]
MDLSHEDFEWAVAEALDRLPAAVLAILENVVFLVEEEPTAELGECLGVYDGVPLPERGFAPPLLPDRIVVFRGPTLRACRDLDSVRHEVAITLAHEIGHYVGLDDRRLDELGWG